MLSANKSNSAVFNYWVIAGSFKPEIPVVDPCNSTGEAAIYIFKIYCGDGFFAESGAGVWAEEPTGNGPHIRQPNPIRISILTSLIIIP